MKIRLLKRYIKESLGREIMFSPERLSRKDTAADQQRELTKIKTIDKTNLSLEEVLEELILSADPSTYIRFVDKFGDIEIPKFEVSPKVRFHTPHGIYGYPLDQNNLSMLVTKGQPTSADFATNFGFFHLYKIDKSKTANVTKDNEEQKLIVGKYTNKQTVIDDMAECIRLSTGLITHRESEDAVLQDYKDLEKDIRKLKTNNSTNPHDAGQADLELIYTKYSHLAGNVDEKKIEEKQSLINIYKFEIADAMYEYMRRYFKRFGHYKKNVSKQYSHFIVLKEAIGEISTVIAKMNNYTSRGQYYSLLLKAVGIQGITDEGTSTIHGNEPEQAVSFDFSGNTIKPIGTFVNVFKNKTGKHKTKFNEILKGLVDNNLVDWQPEYGSEAYNYDFKNLSLKSFKSIINKINDNNKLLRFVRDTAVGNKNKDVALFICKNFNNLENKPFFSSSIFSLLLSNENKIVSEEYIKSFYEKHIKPEILRGSKFTDAYSVLGGNILNFLSSSSLSKSIMLDIINSTKVAKISTGTSNVIIGLAGSRFLDKDVCERMIDKFGYESIGIKNNIHAPVSEIMHEKIKSSLGDENILQKDKKEIKNIIISSIAFFNNRTVSKDELVKVCRLIKPVLKLANFGLSAYEDSQSGFYAKLAIKSLVYNVNFSSEIFDILGVTLEREVNIFQYLIEDSWGSENDEDWDEDGDEQEFDLIKDGLPYLENHHPKRDMIKKNLSRAYNYTVMGKKHGIY